MIAALAHFCVFRKYFSPFIFCNNLIWKSRTHKTIICCARFFTSLDKHCARLPANLDEDQMHFSSGRSAAFRLHRALVGTICAMRFIAAAYIAMAIIYFSFSIRTLRFTKCILHNKTDPIFLHGVFSCGLYTQLVGNRKKKLFKF